MPSVLRWGLCAALGACAISCASIQNGYLAMPLDEHGQVVAGRRTPSGLVISGEERRAYASELFGLVEVTFENTSMDWVRVQTLELDFGDAERDAGVFIPGGDDVDAWYRATLQRNDIRDTNEAVALGALLFLGQVVAAAGTASREPVAQGVGATLVVGASTAALAGAAQGAVSEAGHARPLPDAHLLQVPFTVPPSLFAKKWILLNTHDMGVPCITAMRITYTLEGGEREQVLLPFRSREEGSKWQRHTCGVPRGQWGRRG